MTLTKNPNVEEEYEEYPPLTVEIFKGKKDLKVNIHTTKPPKIVNTKFREDQPLVFVQIGIQNYCWWANWRSFNKLIDMYGTYEQAHCGKPIVLTHVEQAVKGEMKRVIYLKESLTKKSKKD